MTLRVILLTIKERKTDQNVTRVSLWRR